MIEIAYEYFLVGDRLISGWQQWPAHKRPEFVQNDPPLPEMDVLSRDDSGAILSKAGKNFRLEDDGRITVIDHAETEIEALRKISVDDKLAAIIRGIDDPSDPSFLDLKNKLNALAGVVPAGRSK